MNIYVVATPIGNLKDISSRALQVLNDVDLIAAEDTRQTIKLLNSYNITKPLISYHKFNEQSRCKELVHRIMKENLNVALVSDCGTPCISDPGSYLVKEAILNNINIIPIPGASAVISSLSISGFAINEYSFYGFIERNSAKQIEQLKKIKNKDYISVLYESPNRIEKLIQNIAKVDNLAEICACRELTKIHETSYRGTAETILEKILNDNFYNKGEYCIVIQWGKKDDREESEIEKNNSLESEIFYMLYLKLSKNDIFSKLATKNYKRNDIYKAYLSVTQFLENYSL